MSPGLAKRVATPADLNSNHHKNNEYISQLLNDSNKLTASTSSSDTATISSSISHSSNNTSPNQQQQANLKIQNALERNMQKLNHLTKKSTNNAKGGGNLTKEDIELFTNNQQHQEYQQYQQ